MNAPQAANIFDQIVSLFWCALPCSVTLLQKEAISLFHSSHLSWLKVKKRLCLSKERKMFLCSKQSILQLEPRLKVAMEKPYNIPELRGGGLTWKIIGYELFQAPETVQSIFKTFPITFDRIGYFSQVIGCCCCTPTCVWLWEYFFNLVQQIVVTHLTLRNDCISFCPSVSRTHCLYF